MRGVVLSALLVVGGQPAVLFADEPLVEAEGIASVVNGDRMRARERALDEAMRQAVERAATQALDAKTLAAAQSKLRLTLLPHARQYVLTYRVLDESPDGPQVRLRIEAQVAVARLGRDLAGPVGAARATRARLLVCLAQWTPPGWTVSPSQKRLEAAIAARGIEVVTATQGCAPAGKDEELDEARAGELVRSVGGSPAGGLQGAVIGASRVDDAGIIRGTSLRVADARVALRLVDGEGRRIAGTVAARTDYQGELGAAMSSAVEQALDAALRELGPQLGARWSPPAAVDAGVTVRIEGLARYAELQALSRALAAVPGVSSVVPRRFEATGAELTVRTAAPASELAAALTRASVEGAAISAESSGVAELRVHVTRAPQPSPTAPASPPPASPPPAPAPSPASPAPAARATPAAPAK